MILRVVLGEHVAPHRWPEVVCLEPQQHLEDLFVERALELAASEVRTMPLSQGSGFIVDENASVLYRRLPLSMATGENALAGGSVVPRLLVQRVRGCNSSSRVLEDKQVELLRTLSSHLRKPLQARQCGAIHI